MQKVPDERADIRMTARGDHQGDRQAAARLARPRPDRDLGDARPAQGGRLRLRRRLGARRPAGVAQDPGQADRQRALYAGMQRRRHDADPAPQGVGILRARASISSSRSTPTRTDGARVMAIVLHPYIMGAPHRLKYFRKIFEASAKSPTCCSGPASRFSTGIWRSGRRRRSARACAPDAVQHVAQRSGAPLIRDPGVLRLEPGSRVCSASLRAALLQA